MFTAQARIPFEGHFKDVKYVAWQETYAFEAKKMYNSSSLVRFSIIVTSVTEELKCNNILKCNYH
jgi:hypothetical protein